MRRAAANRRPLHDHEAGSLEVLDEPPGDDQRHEFVGVVDALAALKAQREGESVGNVLGGGGREGVAMV